MKSTLNFGIETNQNIEKEKFDDDFIALARSVYITNDKRFEVKNEINLLFNTSLREIKDYQEY